MKNWLKLVGSWLVGKVTKIDEWARSSLDYVISMIVFDSIELDEIMKNKLLMGDARKTFKGHLVMENGEKVHTPDTLEDSKSYSDSFSDKLKLIEGTGDLGQPSSKQGEESNPNQLWFMDLNLVEQWDEEVFHSKNNIANIREPLSVKVAKVQPSEARGTTKQN